MPIITPIQTPASSAQKPNTAAQDSRARAISMLQGGTNQEQSLPVLDPSKVGAEEMSALNQQTDGQKDTSETSEQPEVTRPKEDPQSDRLLQLARREKAIRAKAQVQEAAYKAREAELMAREEAIKAKDLEYQTKYIAKDRFTQDPWNTMSELGVTYDQLTQQVLTAGNQDPQVRAMIEKIKAETKAEIQAVREMQEKQQKAHVDLQQQQYDQAVAQIKRTAHSLVESDPAFETVKATNSVQDVVDLIKETFDKEGELLSVEEAAQAVEDYLVDEALKLAKISKIQKRLQSVAPASAKQQTLQKQPQQTGMKTLTNSIGASRPSSARERAIAAFKGEK